MHYETFRGRDVKEALSLVRAAFGTDAIISSTRVVTNGRDGGLEQSFVEVKAAPSDAPPQLRGAESQRAFPFARREAERAKAAAAAAASAAASRPSGSSQVARPSVPSPIAVLLQKSGSVPPPRIDIRGAEPDIAAEIARAEILRADKARAESARAQTARADAARADAMESEVRALRQLVEQMVGQRAPKERILSELSDVGIEGKLAGELSTGVAKAMKDSSVSIEELLRTRLEKRVGCTEITFREGQKRLIACVGPTGVGKTTTLAKLAAHSALEKGLPTAIITLDTFRVGAIEQMKRFASLIDVPFFVAHDEASLLNALRSCPDIVLVDTPSRGPKDEAAMSRLCLCLDSVAGDYERDVLLAIPAHMRASDTQDLVRSYGRVSPTACVLTKLDETRRPGGAVSGAIAAHLDIAFLSNGPKVPEDLLRATPNDVALAVLPKIEPHR